jgi:uncharacterized protein (DUF3084 family)
MNSMTTPRRASIAPLSGARDLLALLDLITNPDRAKEARKKLDELEAARGAANAVLSKIEKSDQIDALHGAARDDRKQAADELRRAKEIGVEARTKADAAFNEREVALARRANALADREAELDGRSEALEPREAALAAREEEVARAIARIKALEN